MAEKIDTKYFCSYRYQQGSFWGSDYSVWPQIRFDNNITRFYYYQVRTGFMFHPYDWLDTGIYYKYIDQIVGDRWRSENRFEFEFVPNIVWAWNEDKDKSASKEVVTDDEIFKENGSITRWLGDKASSLFQILNSSQLEYRNLDTARINNSDHFIL